MATTMSAQGGAGGGSSTQGFLFKQGKMISNWKKRWFQVMGNKIYYYKTKPTGGDPNSSSSEKPRGFIALDKTTVVKPYDSPLKQNKVTAYAPPSKDENCRFSVSSPGRTFYLIAESEREMQHWVQRLNQLLSELYNIPNPTMSPTPQQLASSSPLQQQSQQQQQQQVSSPLSPRSYAQPSITSSSVATTTSTTSTAMMPRTLTQPVQSTTPLPTQIPGKSISHPHLKQSQQLASGQLHDATKPPPPLQSYPSQEQLQAILPSSVMESVLKESQQPNSNSLSVQLQQSIVFEVLRNLSNAQQLLVFLSESSVQTPFKPQYESLVVSIQDFEARVSAVYNDIDSHFSSSNNNNNGDAAVVGEEPKPVLERSVTQRNETKPTTQLITSPRPGRAETEVDQSEGGDISLPVGRRFAGKKKADDRKRIQNDLFSGPTPDLKRISARVLFQRERVEQEIVDSERSYNAALAACIENFLNPIRTAREKDQITLSDDHLKTVFGNIESVLQASTTVLHQLVEIRDSKSRTVGDVFLEVATTLKPAYSVYVSNYNAGNSLLERLQQEVTPFSKFLKELQQNNLRTVGLSLESYLIMPVQRFPRYVMLLQELMKNTPVVHDDWDSIRLASAKIKDIADTINQTKTRNEHLEKIIEIQKKIAGDFINLADPNRRYIREGFLVKLWDPIPSATTVRQNETAAAVNTSNETYFFLFNDLLVYATPHKSHSFFSAILENETFQFEGFFLFENCKLRDHPDTEEQKHTFSLVYNRAVTKEEVCYKLAAYSADSKKQWMNDIEDLIRQQSEKLKKSVESDESSECSKSGWLSKRGGKLKINKRRWFRLQGNTLFYFNSDKVNTPLGSIHLLEYSVVPDKQEQKKNPFCIRLYHPTKRNYWFFAASQYDMTEWISALRPTVLSISEEFEKLIALTSSPLDVSSSPSPPNALML
eukprot:TRINITY_DN84_c0_g2_i1.p1 TRINITY_DN84_c0_g2~~TRINITY_DN84_c0_g2_i1.p1  ORF type:complete len:937 (+),score=259.51 TRINITY_DN84_c0_g2_i1:113-2923(+)